MSVFLLASLNCRSYETSKFVLRSDQVAANRTQNTEIELRISQLIYRFVADIHIFNECNIFGRSHKTAHFKHACMLFDGVE